MSERRWYLAGAVVYLLTGAAHLFGQFGTGAGDAAYQSLTAMMRGYVVDPGTRFNLYEVMECWGLYFGLMCLVLGGVNYAVLHALGDSRHGLRLMAAVNSAGAIVMLVAASWYRFPPPLISFGAALVCFGVCWRTSRDDEE